MWVVWALGVGAAERLDDGLRSASYLYEASGAGACLGVILELAIAGYWAPRHKALKEWRLHVDRLDEQTWDGRELWDDYVSRLRRGLRLLKASLEGR
jgi:hypothetical protein